MCVLLEEIWGDWLAQGHTRFPENFSPQVSRQAQLEFYKRPFGLSLCHGANGVPVVIAALRGILGFDQSETQINTYYLNPNLLHLEWVKGEIPLKEGILRYEITQTRGGTIEIPEGCVVHIGRKQDRKSLRTFKRAGVYRIE